MKTVQNPHEREYTGLERNLLRLSDYYLSASKLRYQDDVVETLESLYCIKEVETEERADGEDISLLRHPLAVIGKFRSRGRSFRGIDGKFYRESHFVNWSRAKPLLVKLQERIRSGEFSPDWEPAANPEKR
ncbi:MAG: hypothetical protein ACLFN7_03955 [Candidatus Acetothermia bacterium]